MGGTICGVYRYIELNPARAAMVDSPSDYRWGSHHANAHGVDDPIVTMHAEYRRLGSDAVARQAAYRLVFERAVGDDRIQAIRDHVRQQRTLGSERFQQQIEAVRGRSMQTRERGRPRRRARRE